MAKQGEESTRANTMNDHLVTDLDTEVTEAGAQVKSSQSEHDKWMVKKADLEAVTSDGRLPKATHLRAHILKD